ncbi:ATP-NAD/AcoX kinase, partial [mine drainage metagenome]
MRLAFVINPYAGIGVKFRMKGSDTVKERPPIDSYSLNRAKEFLMNLDENIEVVSVSGTMGNDAFEASSSIKPIIIYSPKPPYSPEDTTNFVKEACRSCDLIVFVGGDGTARDVIKGNIIGKPVLGVPAGMKMYSSVFASSPESASELVNRLFNSGTINTEFAEIIDLDEDKFQKGEVNVQKYADAKIPKATEIIRDPKNLYPVQDVDMIANFIIDSMDDSYYIIGTGSTCKSILKLLGYNTNPLGVDLLRKGKLISQDVFSEDFKMLNDDIRVKLILTPTGGQGFILGRGNRQIEMGIINRIRKEDIIVISSQEKLDHLK